MNSTLGSKRPVRILVEKFRAEVIEWLGKHGEVVIVDPWVEPKRWQEEVSQADAIISRKGKITRVDIDKSCGRLKIIARTGVGVDVSRVDLDAAIAGRVWVTNVPGGNAVSVAELVFGQMISLVRKTVPANEAVKKGRWAHYLEFMGSELAGKTLGIVGMGHIGTRVAIRARVFEMAVLVTDPYIPESHVVALGGSLVPLHALLADSDIVTLHCPLNNETRKMIGREELAMMKVSSFIINAARGGIVDENSLLQALKGKRIAGAALDVMVDEPPREDHPLLSLDNVIFTPHLGAATAEASARGEWRAAEEVARVLQSQAPLNPVNKIG